MTVTKGMRVAIVDDVSDSAENAAWIAEEAGLEPAIISEGSGPFGDTSQLLKIVRNENCSAVICDHRLSRTVFASFTGAEFVSRIYQEYMPGILVSTFAAIDSDTSIRLHRANLPSVISRADLDPDLIIDGLHRCEAELNGDIAPDRRSRRTLIRVIDMYSDGATPVVEAILHSWDPDRAVRFPVNVIDNEQIVGVLTSDPMCKVRLFAEVNVGCIDESGLFFRSFEFAPEPDLDELKT